MVVLNPVDIYCERITPGFGAEPLNALSNVVVIIATMLALRTAIF